jgi:hypothetical protein
MRRRGHASNLPVEKGNFTSNRTYATTKSNPFPSTETYRKATANDDRDPSYAETKGEKIRPVGTIAREGL